MILDQDIFDSRDVERRIESLESDKEDATEYPEEFGDMFGEDEAEELANLVELRDELSGYCDWIHGATIISDDHFEKYAEELARDCGDIPHEPRWPQNHIDWSAAADALQQDYTSAEVDGVTYWVR